VFFTNSGAEAVECAIKTARRYHYVAGNGAASMTSSPSTTPFHGRTLGTISATNQEKMRDGFEPLLPGFAYASSTIWKAALALMVRQYGGFPGRADPGRGRHPTRRREAFLQGLRKVCDDNGLLLVLDEVQCGYGAHRQALRARALWRGPGHHRGRQGHRRRFPARRLPRDRGSRQGHGDRHARFDLWRQPAGHGGGARRCST
jgi:hypothetical protein